VNSHFEELIQRELDDDLSAAEEAELLAGSTADPEVHRAREEMRALARELETLGTKSAPEGLTQSVMREIDALPIPRAGTRRRSWRPSRGEALAFAAGIVLVLGAGLVLPRLGEVPVDPEQAAGTIGIGNRIDAGAVQAPGLNARAWTSGHAGTLQLHVEGEVSEALPLEIRFDARQWAVSYLQSSSVTTGDLAVDTGRIAFARVSPGVFGVDVGFVSLDTSGSFLPLEVRGGPAASGAISLKTRPAGDAP
jgi:hypothetical protein